MRYLLLLSALLAFSVGAHPVDMGLAEVDVHGSDISVTLDMYPDTAAKLIGLSKLSPIEAESRAPQLLAATLEKSSFTIAGQSTPCAWRDGSSALSSTSIRIAATAHCETPVTSFHWNAAFLQNPLLPDGFRLVAQRPGGGSMVSGERGREDLAFEAVHPSFPGFIAMGIEHIGAAPSEWVSEGRFHFPDGIDHILFVVALALCGGTFLGLAKAVTGFTVGHSITLALGTLGWVTLPSRLVESAIALSIAVLALEAALRKRPVRGWWLAAVFGLVHGLGLASALRELSLPRQQLFSALLGYNVGVELGQLAILAIAFPATLLLRRTAQDGLAVRLCAMPIAALGAWWFVERAFAL